MNTAKKMSKGGIGMKRFRHCARHGIAVASAMVLLLAATPFYAAADTAGDLPASVGNTADDRGDISYSDYITAYAHDNAATTAVTVPATQDPRLASGKAPDIRTLGDGQQGNALMTEEGDTVTWNISVPQTGYYSVVLIYYPLGGNGSPILRDVLVDGAIPFKESKNISFERLWSNETNDKSYDLSGNQVLPAQVEKPDTIRKAATDATGYINTPLLYRLESGEHTLSLVGQREPMLLFRVELVPEKAEKTYADVVAGYREKGYTAAHLSEPIVIQAEDAARKSDQTVYPTADRSSPAVYPYSPSVILYNTIGGTQWSTVGQWIEWDVTVPQDGLYTIGTHFKQALKSGSASIRELFIDGEVPFVEARDIAFPYKNSWQSGFLGNGDGEPYQFYLTAGQHTVRLQAGMGNTASNLVQAKEYLLALNAAYRQIVVVTGTSPDSYRDYHFEQAIPETLAEIARLSQCLKDLAATVQEQNGGLVQSTATIRRLFQQMDEMTENPNDIALILSTWKDNIAAFGTWINSQGEQPLVLDALYLCSADNAVIPAGEAGFFRLLKHHALQFFYSFLSDYSSVGELESNADTSIRVWMFSGRDQAQILRRQIGNNFTPQENISVNLQLVSTGALLPAVLAKSGPDVCIGLTQEEPLNLALRNGLADLSSMDGFDDVASRFAAPALEPFYFNGRYWALPETQTYAVLFYRTDILKEMGIGIDELDTWESILIHVLPKLRRSSLAFGILPGLGNYSMFLYQYGGDLYYNEGRNSGLGSAQAIRAMNDYSILYTQYGLDLAFDFANRFRSGEMPIAVSDFTSYNQLTVFAPEVKGLWNIAPVPGTLQEDGTVDHTSTVTVTGGVMLEQSRHKEAGWSFLKWWTDAGTQTAYGREVESIVGAAARYNSANKEAFESVQWDSAMKKVLLQQADHLQAIPQVPGGYFTTRSYDFAFRDIVYDGEEVRETMLNTTDTIDKEIANKREEYHLD